MHCELPSVRDLGIRSCLFVLNTTKQLLLNQLIYINIHAHVMKQRHECLSVLAMKYEKQKINTKTFDSS